MDIYLSHILLCVAISSTDQSSINESAPDTHLEKADAVLRISARITYIPSSLVVRVQNSTTPDLGFNPSLTDTEVKAILALEKVETLECYFCPVGYHGLNRIMRKHNLRRLVLGYGRDETSALLSRFKSLESIDFRDGDVTHSGLIFLGRLPNLKKLHISTQRIDLVNIEAAVKRFTGIDFVVSQ